METIPAGASFGLVLRACRRRAGLTQEELAARAGLSDRAIRELERGRVSQPRRSTVVLLAKALSLSAEEAVRFREAALDNSGSLPSVARGVDPSGSPLTLPMPSQLPPAVPDFVGRTELAQQLTKMLTGQSVDGTRRGVVVVGLDGLAGVGKTALAVHVAHNVRHHFPHGQLHVDLRGAHHHPAEPAEVLAGFLRAFGVAEAAMPNAEEERAALYRSLVSDRRMLVLLDNARDEAQVRPLLPGTRGCAVLVTSRSRLHGLCGATLFDLDVLSHGEALELLRRLVGAHRVDPERQAADSLLTLCGHLPLAVRIAGTRLAARPFWSIRTLVGRLAEDQARLDELQLGDVAVRASFSVSYRLLHEVTGPSGVPPARAFRLLGLLNGPDLSVPTSAAALGISRSATGRLLELLVDAGLLESSGTDRYRFHDLLRLFAREQAADDEPVAERIAVIQRVVRYALETIQHVDRLVRPGSLMPYNDDVAGSGGLSITDYDEALGWLDAEHANLVALTAQAARTPGVPVDLVACLAAHVSGFLEVRGLWDDHEQLARLVLKAAERDDNPHARALAGHELGLVARRRCRPAEAHRWFAECLAVYRGMGDRAGEARALNNLGNLAGDRGDYAEGLRLFTAGLAICAQYGIAAGAGLINNIAFMLEALGRHGEAITRYEECIAENRKIGNRDGEAVALNNLGNVHRKRGNPAEAVVCQWGALALCRRSGNLFWAADTLIDLAASYRDLGRADLAVRHCEEGLRISRQVGDRQVEARAFAELGQAWTDLGNADRGVTAWREAVTIFDSLGEFGAGEAAALRSRLERVS